MTPQQIVTGENVIIKTSAELNAWAENMDFYLPFYSDMELAELYLQWLNTAI